MALALGGGGSVIYNSVLFSYERLVVILFLYIYLLGVCDFWI